MKNKVSFREVLKTLHADLIGKDSHRGITLTYGWLANQVGHFALGFVPVCAFNLAGHTLIRSLLYVASFWLLFEIYNALSPLYKKEYKGNGSFKPQWGNLVFDTFTDLCFFWTGGLTYYFIASDDKSYIVWYLTGLALLGLSIRYWFLTKLYQQNAFLPYQFRLSQWDGPILPKDIETINAFLSDGKMIHHFLVFGSKGKGKTRLTVGMANEIAIRHRLSTYTTLSKWVNLLQEDDITLENSKLALWNWTESDMLLIDDINPGTPSESNKYKTTDILKYIHLQNSDRNLNALRKINVAWVVGTAHDNETIDNWKEFIQKLGIPDDSIFIIDLDRA